ncbi:hypothetical protein OIU77_005764, partial [Salix suchowensis]
MIWTYYNHNLKPTRFNNMTNEWGPWKLTVWYNIDWFSSPACRT